MPLMVCASTHNDDQRNYDLKNFTSNYHKYNIGDIAPDINFTPDYEIKAWRVRHLPMPQAGAFWSYMDGTYVMLRKSDRRIISAKSSDIFYPRMID